MKKLLLFQLILLSSSVFHAQDSFLKPFIDAPLERIDFIDIDNLDGKQLFLKTDYSKSRLLNPELIDGIKKKQITEVKLVYSDFQQIEAFNQYDLNADRVRNLHSLWPELFQDELTLWKVVAQTACEDISSCEELPHGFIISWREDQTTDLLEEEIEFLNRKIPFKRLAIQSQLLAADGNAVPYLFDTDAFYPGGFSELSRFINEQINFPKEALAQKLDKSVKASFEIGLEGQLLNLSLEGESIFGYTTILKEVLKIMPRWGAAIRKGEPVSSKHYLSFHFKNDKFNKPIVTIDAREMPDYIPSLDEIMDEYRTFYKDSVVVSSLNRNQWENAAVVMDVTGSMSPYTAQLLLWMNLNEEAKIQYTFFNDGDNMPDALKTVGETGGIYPCLEKDLESIFMTATNTMRLGSGGDLDENYFEAMLSSIEAFPERNTLIVIADNSSLPSDRVLLEQIDRPIRLVLCGARAGINTTWLDIIRQNKGSIHLIEQDIVTLAYLSEGETIEIQGRTYRIKEGKFKRE